MNKKTDMPIFLTVILTIYLISFLITGYLNPIGQYCVLYKSNNIDNKINDIQDKLNYNNCNYYINKDQQTYCNDLVREYNFYVSEYNGLICIK